MSKKYCAVPNDLMQQILDYLQTKEYREVAGMLLDWNARHVPNIEVSHDGEVISNRGPTKARKG